jgi:hypothetical protein
LRPNHQTQARAAEKSPLPKDKKTKTGLHGGHPAQKRHTAAAISLAAHPKLWPSGLLLLLGQKFGLLGLLGLLLLLLLLLRQRGGGGGGAGGTSSNGALLGALDGGDREQREHVVVVAVAVAVAAVAVVVAVVAAVAVAAENALVLT